MAQSPFAFYRGSAAVMAADLATTPTCGLRVQACGDAHLMNFGGFANARAQHLLRHQRFRRNPAREDWDATMLREYGKLCAWARAHARSGDPAKIAGYMGSNTTFDDAICEFGVEYADQNLRDHRAFVKAIREGRIKVVSED